MNSHVAVGEVLSLLRMQSTSNLTTATGFFQLCRQMVCAQVQGNLFCPIENYYSRPFLTPLIYRSGSDPSICLLCHYLQLVMTQII